MKKQESEVKAEYEKPSLNKHENLRELTFDCVDWNCSVTVPPAP